MLNNPLNYEDPSGNVADTIWDIGGFLWSVYDYLKDPTSQNRNAVLVDAAFALAPLVPNPQITKAKKVGRAIKDLEKTKIGTRILKTTRAIKKGTSTAKSKVNAIVKQVKKIVHKKACNIAEKLKI